ncbi:MAG: response regulator transcription factor [Elusimicrobiota bacterium]
MGTIKILLIDDEEDFHDIIRQVLEPAGYEILGAKDAESGFKALYKEKPDLLILDVNMPLQDGYAVCLKVRTLPEFIELPILMLTIRNQDNEIIKGLDCGADDYLTKPFDPLEMLARIRKLLARG